MRALPSAPTSARLNAVHQPSTSAGNFLRAQAQFLVGVFEAAAEFRLYVDPSVLDKVKVGDKVDLTWSTDATVAVQ
jgi:hypothetical protein